MERTPIVIVRRGDDGADQQGPERRGPPQSHLQEAMAARGMVLRESRDSIFSEAWVPMGFLLLLAGFIAARNAPLMALGATLLVIYGVSAWWRDNALRGVYYRRTFDRTRVFPGEPVRMTIHVSNQKRLPLSWLRFDDHVPLAPREAGELAEVISDTHGEYRLKNLFALGPYGQETRDFTFVFPRRGFIHFGPVSYHSGDIFTLFTIEREHDARSRIVVYPRIWPLEQLGLPAKEPFGDLNVHKSLFTDPIRTQGIRDYHPRDRFRDIHWKVSARRGQLQTKVYDPSTGMTLAIFLNVSTLRRHWLGFHPEQLERAISVAASAANYAAEQKWAIGLYVNGAVPQSDQSIRVPPGRSPEQLSHVLEALAATREFATASIEKLMLHESPRLPWPATMLLVTAYLDKEITATLVRLKEAGRRVALISLADEAPATLPGIITYHVPASATGPGQQDEEERAMRNVTERSLAAIPIPEDVRPAGDGNGAQ
ncbi:MAG: DUF58 domain-containing protein [Chloroflexota bacterium]